MPVSIEQPTSVQVKLTLPELAHVIGEGELNVAVTLNYSQIKKLYNEMREVALSLEDWLKEHPTYEVKQKKGRGESYGVILPLVRKYIEEHKGEIITNLKLAEALGISKQAASSALYRACNDLRIITYIGREPNTIKRNLYQIPKLQEAEVS